jgi:hypothetical protein
LNTPHSKGASDGGANRKAKRPETSLQGQSDFQRTVLRLGCRYAADDERQINATVDLLTYAFGSIFEADLSTLQSGAARYIIRLMLEVPGATIETLTDFLTGKNYLKPEYQESIKKLRGPAKSYFENRFEHLRPETKSGILDRLYILREHSAIDGMFCAADCKLDLYTEMQSGKVIIVNADKDYLTQDRTELFGRFFIAMLLQAAQQRAPLRDDQKLPCFCYIDEAHDYIRKDPRVPVLIDQPTGSACSNPWRRFSLSASNVKSYWPNGEPPLPCRTDFGSNCDMSDTISRGTVIPSLRAHFPNRRVGGLSWPMSGAELRRQFRARKFGQF